MCKSGRGVSEWFSVKVGEMSCLRSMCGLWSDKER